MKFDINKENLIGQKITVIGLKKSGYAAAVLGHELGANIFVSEINNDTEIISNKNNLIKKGIRVETVSYTHLTLPTILLV